MLNLDSQENDIDIMLIMIDSLILSESFDVIDSIFEISPTTISLPVVYILLAATQDVKDKLPNRAVFHTAAKKYYLISETQWDEVQ